MSIRNLLVRARGILAAIAPITPLKLDDTLVLVIDAILADAELFGWFEGKVAAADSGSLSIEAGPPEALAMALERRGIKWGQVAASLPAILELIRLLRG